MSNLHAVKKESELRDPKEGLIEIEKEMYDIIEEADEYMWNKGEIGGIDWGIDSFNDAFNGLQPGLIMVAGQPNIGKSALCMNLTWSIVNANMKIDKRHKKKAYVIYFTLDDSDKEIIPRIIAIDQKIPINAISSPKKYEENLTYMTKREAGLKKLKDMVSYFKVLDLTKGDTIEFIEDTIKSHKIALSQKDEDYQVVAIVDNFHDIKIRDQQFASDKKKFDYISDKIKDMTVSLDLPFICTGEFRKLNGIRRPVMDDIKETSKISYVAKAVLLCYNEVGLRGDTANVYYQRPNDNIKMPVMEAKIGKNKFTSQKNRLFFEFIPELSYLKPVRKEGSIRYNQMIVG